MPWGVTFRQVTIGDNFLCHSKPLIIRQGFRFRTRIVLGGTTERHRLAVLMSVHSSSIKSWLLEVEGERIIEDTKARKAALIDIQPLELVFPLLRIGQT